MIQPTIVSEVIDGEEPILKLLDDIQNAVYELEQRCSHWEISKSPNVANEYRMQCKVEESDGWAKLDYRRNGESLHDMALRCIEKSITRHSKGYTEDAFGNPEVIG